MNKKKTKFISREGCGVPDCVYNEHFRCKKKEIEVNEGSKCLTIKRYRYRFGTEKGK